ncbi:MAG: phosphoglycerate mutase family protein [Thermoflexales bacterium]|nr:phosphoglycerate mutase family protein [Thermoflexales bacterium]
MPLQVTFVRHAQSVNNALWSSGGTPAARVDDPELTPLGWQQARHLAAHLARNGVRYTHLFSSLMLRAVQTGHCIAEQLNMPLIGWLEMHELGGMYMQQEPDGACLPRSGQTRAFFARYFPRLVLPDSVTEAGWWNRPFEGEAERYARAQRVWQEICAACAREEHWLMVTHSGFLNVLFCAMLSVASESATWFRFDNASLTEVVVACAFVEVRRVNDTSFLPPELRS